MRIRSVNVGMPAPLTSGGRTARSGIVKAPVEGRVRARRHGLAGDGQADPRIHGGPDKAVYAYPVEHYAHWAAELGRDDLGPGCFGENLTVEGLLEDELAIGDVLRAGDALFEISQPRMPCFKLEMRLERPGFMGPFLGSGRVGFYLRVLREGGIAAGDAMVRERPAAGSMSVRDVALLLLDSATAEDLERGAAVAALSRGWRDRFARRAARARRQPRLF
ncbi:MOSC domain-containing protein [Miltoncostaea marina]|uniref:MOSC domain-containing protein n=1 Tax=Miltoncostaea marina TaxID=2843215 RepID=UPI001C3CB0A5|nr:MOSC domain-containing protein [Miltoncostaea marina]